MAKVIFVVGLMAAVIVGLSIFPPWTRTDTVEVTAIDDGYQISIESKGRLLQPLSLEGAFQKWSDCTTLFAEGPGEQVEMDKVAYKKYTIGKNLQGKWFYKCVIYISDSEKRLIVQGELADKHRVNHSGIYDNITISRPEIFSIDTNAKIVDINHDYIRAKGRFIGWKFVVCGKEFGVNDKPSDDSGEWEVIASVKSDYANNVKYYLPYLFIISCKKVSEQ